jgi:uncharacterized membrane protein YdbT with pleckstrin-like domain
LNAEEELVLDLRPHWIYLAGAVALLVLAIVVDLVIAFALDWDFGSWWKLAIVVVMLLALLAALAYFLRRYAKWATTHFVVTSERLIAGRGVISKNRKEIPLDRINDVSFHQGIFERLVGAGDLTIESAGERGQETFSDIRHPDRVQQEIYNQTKRNQTRQYQAIWQGSPQAQAQAQAQAQSQGPTATAPAPSAPPNVPEQIEQLTDMFRRGLLSQQEYDQKKAELLRRM